MILGGGLPEKEHENLDLSETLMVYEARRFLLSVGGDSFAAENAISQQVTIELFLTHNTQSCDVYHTYNAVHMWH